MHRQPGAAVLLNTGISHRIGADVYRVLRDILSSGDAAIDPILEQILSKEGKCIRPAFMELVAGLNGGTWLTVEKAAAVVEAVHLASLLHDDVLDGASHRRGVATVNARHSDKISVLFGDYIFITALHMARSIGNRDAETVLFSAVTRMVGGEIRDTLENGFCDEETYLDIIGRKTASLFAAAGEISILLTGGSTHASRMGAELGECVGIAFQIVDDALDYTGDHSLMGKPAHIDALTGNITLPLIYAMKDMSVVERARVFDGSLSIDDICDLVVERGGIEYSLERAREYISRGKYIISQFGNTEFIDIFARFFDAVIDRNA
jgi:octaprenyl-diphosphate synthase